MKTYKIPVSWTVTSTMEVDAENVLEACQKADAMPLPTDAEYLDASFRVDHNMLETVNDELSDSDLTMISDLEAEQE